MATTEISRLQSFEHHIEDMRNHTLCKICLKPFYEPFILACGHTFCYSCLRSWFGAPDDRRKTKNCPDCRAEVVSQPCPNYLLRDLVHLFVGRAELLPEDETIEEHDMGKREEATLLATDRADSGLFRGLFHKRPYTAHRAPIIDLEDNNTLRCPECTWELEDGFCEHCGFGEENSDSLDEDGFTNPESALGDRSSMDPYEDEHGNSRIPPPRPFYGIESDAESYTDDTEARENDHLHAFGVGQFPYSADDDELDEMDGFIDDDEEVSSEIDDDGMGLDPFYDRDRNSELSDRGIYLDGDDEDDDEEDDEEDDIRQLSSNRSGPPEYPASQTDEGTQYDYSDTEESIVQELPRRGRQQVIISDDDEENEESAPERNAVTSKRSESVLSNTVADSTERSQSGLEDDSDSEEQSLSDDTTVPAQPATRRRQRLDILRARRTNASWRPYSRPTQTTSQGSYTPGDRARTRGGDNQAHRNRRSHVHVY